MTSIKQGRKIGLVIEGGGMKCAYEAGVTDGFIDEGITFDYGIGVSAGSANLLSYMAGQRGRSGRFYIDHIKEPGYFGLRSFLKTGNLFGLQYIYGDLTNTGGGDPLDYDALMATGIDFHVVATDAMTGQPRYFTREEIRKDDYKEVMASCAIPVVSKPVQVGKSRYFDGGISDAIPVQKALDEGCDKLVILLSKNRDFVRKPQSRMGFIRLALRKYPGTIRAIENRKEMYDRCQALVYELEEQGRAFVFAASQPLDIGTYTMDPEKNREIYELGLSDFRERREDLLVFLKE